MTQDYLRTYLLTRSGVWSRLATSFQRASGSSLENTISARQIYKINIVESGNHAKSSTKSDTLGPEFVLYELNLLSLVRESIELYSDESMQKILSIIQTEASDPAQWDRRGSFYGVTMFKVGNSPPFSRART